MNVNVYIEDDLGKEITKNAKKLGKTRNALIREALKEWLENHKASQWPSSVKNFCGVSDFPRFESYRTELSEPNQDPLQ